MAFMLESILLLVFLAASLAVLTQVFTASLVQSAESRTLDAASVAATGVAERFAADPTAVDEQTQVDDLLVLCRVDEEKRDAGILYRAHIRVYDAEAIDAAGSAEVAAATAISADPVEAVFALETSRYVSGVR